MSGRDAGTAGRFRWAMLANAPRSVWLLSASFLFLLLVGTALYPPYRGPDEPQHVDMAVALTQGFSPLWVPDSREVSQAAWTAGLIANTRIATPQRLAEREAPPRSERASFEELGVEQPSGAGNQLVQHPPGYYLLLAGALQAVPRWQLLPADLVVGLLRVVGILLVAPLPLIAWATARRLGGPPGIALTAAVMMLGVPQLVHITASVNNDSLQNLAAALCTMFAAFIATGDSSRRTAVLAGLALGVGLMAKGLILVFVGVLTLAYAFAWLRARGKRRSVVVSAVLAGIVAGAVGGWWWVRNVIITGRVQPSGFDRPQEPVRGWGAEAWVWLQDLVTFVLIRFWFDHPSGSRTGISVTASWVVTLVVVILVVAVFVGRTRVTDPSRFVLSLLLLPILLLSVLVIAGSYESFRLGYDQPALQGRYLFPGIVGVAAVVAVGAHRLAGPRSLLPLFIVTLWVVGSQTLAAISAVRLYWWPAEGGPLALLRGMAENLPWPGPTVVTVMVISTLLWAVTAVRLVQDARTCRTSPAEEAGVPGRDVDDGRQAETRSPQ